ncbi:MAG TPA: DUF4252 domain-containing protein [Terriglobia bacterium]|nr:DUF4252 domain-containing protein [Terriglobia bacterium]
MKTPTTNFCRQAGMLLAFTCAGLLLNANDARAQNGRLEINHLEKLADKAAEVVDVNLDGALLQLASKFMSDKRDPDEAAAKDFIQHLQGIYVKSYEFDKEGEYSRADVDEIRQQLRAPTWKRTVEVRSKRDGDNAEVYLMPGKGSGDDAIKGLAILCAEPKELTVVNIVGPINLDKLAALDGEMGVPRLGLVRTGKGKRETKDGKENKDGKDSQDGKDSKEATSHDQAK